MKLVTAFDELIGNWQPHFAQQRTFERARGLAFSSVVTFGRHTVSRLICSKNMHDRDWSADYRFCSTRGWDANDLFFEVLKAGDRYAHWPSNHVVAALDDTLIGKTGKKIPGVRTLRDPMSLPYHVNLIPGLRFLQASILVNPNHRIDCHRAIPILFEEASPAKKPSKNASEEEKERFKKEQKEKRISVKGIQALCQIRTWVDQLPNGSDRQVFVSVDGSFCNKTFMRSVPDEVVPIARARKDLKLHKPPDDTMRANRVYGERLPTPNEIRQDDSYPWQKANLFFAGGNRDIRYKVLEPVLWPCIGPTPCRVIILAATGYRLRKGSKKLYREPVYLITTDLETPVELLIQYYLLRWDIEVNHRDEKSLLGVGDAQVRSPLSVERNPQFAVATYSMLLLASLRAYGAERTEDYLPLPKWRKEAERRPSTLDIVAQFRREVMMAQLQPALERTADSARARENSGPQAESTGFVTTSGTSQSRVDLPVSILAALLYADA